MYCRKGNLRLIKQIVSTKYSFENGRIISLIDAVGLGCYRLLVQTYNTRTVIFREPEEAVAIMIRLRAGRLVIHVYISGRVKSYFSSPKLLDPFWGVPNLVFGAYRLSFSRG